MILNKYFTLNNNVKIPAIGLGTWQISNDMVSNVVIKAIENGYTHIDTAVDYNNEVGVGKALKLVNKNRKDIFITTKIPAHVKDKNQAIKVLEKSFSDLSLDYIDLVLIHSPRPWDQLWDKNAYRYYKENIEVWNVLEEYYLKGKIKAIGLSNFFIDDIKNILDNCKVKPMVNQICVFIGNTPFDIIDFCFKNDILVEAYSPIATGRLINHPEITKIANKYNVTLPQLCIKYCLQLNTLPLPKSCNIDHIIENTKLDFTISLDDMEILKNMKI